MLSSHGIRVDDNIHLGAWFTYVKMGFERESGQGRSGLRDCYEFLILFTTCLQVLLTVQIKLPISIIIFGIIFFAINRKNRKSPI
jgi:hypothetical protein